MPKTLLRLGLGLLTACGFALVLYAQQPSNTAQIGGTAIVTAGVNGTAAVGGNQATNSNLSANVYPVLVAGSDYGGTAKIQNWKVDSSGIGYVQFSAAQSVTFTNTSIGLVPLTAGGTSDYHAVCAASANAANIKASAGQVYAASIYNNAGYPIYVKFHNTAGTPTPGSGVVTTFGVQAGTQRDITWPNGMAFGTGIGITAVKDIADAGSTVLVASDCVLDVQYK